MTKIKSKARKKVKKKTKSKVLGAPTKYDKKYCEEIIEYFSGDPYREVIVETPTRDGIVMTKEDKANDLPTYAGFAAKIDVDRDTLREWCKNHDIFSVAYKKCKAKQEYFLMINGLKGLYHGSFAIFTAKNVINWTDKQDLTNSDGNMSKPTIVLLPTNNREKE